MKKFCGMLIVAFTLLVVGSYNNRAEAYDYYVGTWRSGYDAYLMTETINVYDMGFRCTIKAVQGRSVMYINYHFYWRGSERRFSNSDGVDNAVNNGTSIEKNTWQFVAQHYRL